MSSHREAVSITYDDLESALEWSSSDEGHAYISKRDGSSHFAPEFVSGEEIPDDVEDASLYWEVPHKNQLGLGRSLAFRYHDRSHTTRNEAPHLAAHPPAGRSITRCIARGDSDRNGLGRLSPSRLLEYQVRIRTGRSRSGRNGRGGHSLLLESIDEGQLDVPVCIGGRRACPPEDVGGPHRFSLFLAAMKDRKHPNHRDFKEWYDGVFDPEDFDIAEVNALLTSEFER